jgi:NAD+ synthase
MNCSNVTNYIMNWMAEKLESAKLDGFVVGVSGGVDSALVSILSALTGKRTVCMNMPINQAPDQLDRAEKHIKHLQVVHKNVENVLISLTPAYEALVDTFKPLNVSELAKANTRSRLRMVTLYAMANTNRLLVLGTGNKVEDYGVGFFTKGGDGMIDISPIGDLMKSEVRELSRFLGILPELSEAVPTDGLWDDDKHTDEQQIGASYDELEWTMKYCANFADNNLDGTILGDNFTSRVLQLNPQLTTRQREVIDIYIRRHKNSRHKMEMPPICKIPQEFKEYL